MGREAVLPQRGRLVGRVLHPDLPRVPEPAAATARLKPGENVFAVSSSDLRRPSATCAFRELAKYLIAFLIYNDGIGTIIGVAVIYGAELGFGMTETILALVLVQFVGIPYSLVFGRIPSRTERRGAIYLAFVVFNLIVMPARRRLRHPDPAGRDRRACAVRGRGPRAVRRREGRAGARTSWTEEAVVLDGSLRGLRPEAVQEVYVTTEAAGDTLTSASTAARSSSSTA